MIRDSFTSSGYKCCMNCTPETGRTACDENGRNCHSYCKRYLDAVEESMERKRRQQIAAKRARLYTEYKNALPKSRFEKS